MRFMSQNTEAFFLNAFLEQTLVKQRPLQAVEADISQAVSVTDDVTGDANSSQSAAGATPPDGPNIYDRDDASSPQRSHESKPSSQADEFDLVTPAEVEQSKDVVEPDP